MKRFGIVMFGLVLAAAYVWAQAPPAQPQPVEVPLKTNVDQASYAIGLNISRTLKAQGLELSLEALLLGIRDSFAGGKPRLTDQQMQAALQTFEREMSAKIQQQRQQSGEKNKVEGQAFLAQNAKKQGVVTLPSGLQYQVLQKGNGPSPKLNDTVRTHYHGTLIDGTVFDSSVERGQPATFPVGGVIRGWTEALQLMRVGDKWRLFLPSELAYGPDGAGEPGGPIGPNAVLVFEVELLGIDASAKPQP